MLVPIKAVVTPQAKTPCVNFPVCVYWCPIQWSRCEADCGQRSTDHMFPLYLLLPGDRDKSLGLWVSMPIQILCPAALKIVGCFPFLRAQCNSLWGRTQRTIIGYTCHGVVGSPLVGTRIFIHLVESRSKSWTRNHGFLLGQLPLISLSFTFDFFWFLCLFCCCWTNGVVFLLVALLFFLQGRCVLLTILIMLCRSVVLWPCTYYNNYVLLASGDEIPHNDSSPMGSVFFPLSPAL